MKLITFFYFLVSSATFAADLKPFEAKYNISRDGKKTGEQVTRLTQLNDNLWKIEDRIVGTNGLASVIGFSRIETTEFTETDGQLQAIKHSMKQKAAFSKKRYSFNWNESAQTFDINHKNKKVTYSPQNQQIISAQLMPIALSKAACLGEQNINLTILKNKHPKTYHFRINQQSPKTGQRVYGKGVKKESKTWFDETKQCLPMKQIHKDQDDPVIETQLFEFKWLQPKQKP